MKETVTLIISIILACSCSLNRKVLDISDRFPEEERQWIQLQNMEKMDMFVNYKDNMYCGDYSSFSSPIDSIDHETFEVLTNTILARDKNGIYYNAETFFSYTTKGCFVNCYLSKIKDADVKTFKVIGIEKNNFWFFSKDTKNVFIRGQKIKDVDVKTFYYKIILVNEIEKIIIGDANNEWEFKWPNKKIKLNN